jgi:NLI interacting factor-like phosphatase
MSKTTNDQSSHHDIIGHHRSCNALSNGADLLPTLTAVSQSQARSNRLQALTNSAPTTTPTEAATTEAAMEGGRGREAPHQLPSAPINGQNKKKKKKKPRTKKGKAANDSSTSGQQQHADSTTTAATQELDDGGDDDSGGVGRPGKKRLRRMRYLQSLVAAADSSSSTTSTAVINHLLYCAQISRFTQSVTLISGVPDVGGMITDICVQPLIVLDLNGVLCHRIRRKKNTLTSPKNKNKNNNNHHTYRPVAFDIANTPVIPRTDIDTFLRYLDEHFCLAVWTSAKRTTAKALVQQLFPSDIANRLLFIWDQQHCDATNTNTNGTNGTNDTNAYGNHKAKKKKKHNDHDDDIVFVKDLAKVWKQYPLWNACNTILMDDSPDKCTQWHLNAVHPPPIHGLRLLFKDDNDNETANRVQQQLRHHHLMSDEENERLQQLFFEGLVHYWQNHKVTITFDEEECGGVQTTTKVVQQQQPHQQQGCARLLTAEAMNVTADHSRTHGLVEYLKIHAVGHMGWEYKKE